MNQLRIGILALVLVSPAAHSQTITTPDASPQALVSQSVGFTDMTIKYHSPAVKGRKVWGSLVPYDGGKPMPWRAGANENTTISFTHDMKVEGKALPAGTYGLHMIPSATDWIIIFSKNHTSWGSFFYRENEDALRVVVRPKPAEHREWLAYGFEVLGPFSATISLHWEKLKVPFKVEVADGHQTILASFRNQLRSLPGFFPQGYVAAANYCITNNINHEEAIAWTDEALARGAGFNARIAKSRLMSQSGKTKDAEEIRKSAIETASENDLNNYGYQLLNDGNTKEALQVFELNVKRHPDSWNVHDSFGEGYERSGNKEDAIKWYSMALTKNPPPAQVERINQILKRLKSE